MSLENPKNLNLVIFEKDSEFRKRPYPELPPHDPYYNPDYYSPDHYIKID
jgi:hypothetical protein